MCAPYDDECHEARGAVKLAEAARRVAQQRLDASGLRGRRQARTELATANEDAATAGELLAAAQETSRDPNTQRATARDQIEAARSELRNQDVYDKWRYLPEHLRATKEHVESLDTWHHWATGNPVNHERLVEAIAVLHEVAARRPDDGTRQLGDALQRWANRQGIQIESPHIDQRRPIEIEIDM